MVTKRYIACSMATGRSLAIAGTAREAADEAMRRYPGVPQAWLEVIRAASPERATRLYVLHVPLPLCRVDNGAVTVFRGDRGGTGLAPIDWRE
tara:strand:- start:30935 stop:31213 length:279 start_codon:yes stop_codon:yes gene_type:complete